MAFYRRGVKIASMYAQGDDLLLYPVASRGCVSEYNGNQFKIMTSITPAVLSGTDRPDSHEVASKHPSLGNGGDAWPQPPVANMPDRNMVIAVAVIDEHSLTRSCITRSLQALCHFIDIVAFANCGDCLCSLRPHDVILYHVRESIANPASEYLVANIKKLAEIAPVIVLGDVDDIESVFTAFESDARGYIPTASTTPELTIEIMHLVKAGGMFVPPSSLYGRTSDHAIAALTTPQLTNRQVAVLDHLKRGKSNKFIAHQLKISESTVKVHIRNIMKKLNATNRTEVAYRAQELRMTNAR